MDNLPNRRSSRLVQSGCLQRSSRTPAIYLKGVTLGNVQDIQSNVPDMSTKFFRSSFDQIDSD
jgi:hypothetical protein